MKNAIITFLAFFFFTINIFAQPMQMTEKKGKKSITVKGKIIDKKSKLPLEYATISLLEKTNNSFLNGSITNKQGEFELETKENNFYLKINFLGYKELVIKDFKIKNNEVDFKNIIIQANQETLDDVVISAEKSQTVFKLDKRVFNVGSDLSTAGGSALDVLNNVPSVDVNLEGSVSLRGNSNVQILINGKPSVLTSGNSNTLGTITADMIERIEVITNPSAKYDAEGTSGILNIVLKKSEKKGLNGSVSINTGVPNNHSIGISINRRTEKLNLFSQLGIGKRTFDKNFEGKTINKKSANQSILDSKSSGEKNEQFYNILLGTDYHINSLNVITLSGHYGYEIEDETSKTDYSLSSSANEMIYKSQRNEITEATNPKWEYDLQYKKSFTENKDRSLIMSAKGSFFGKDKTSDFVNSGEVGNTNNLKQNAKTDFSEAEYTFQLDYTHPFSEGNVFETGTKYKIEKLTNDYQVNDLVNNIWKSNVNYTNVFEFDQKILGTYFTYSYELEKFGIKAGLRVENTQLETILKNENKKNIRNYIDYFPSVHTSYKFTKKFSLQLGYSRRIYRPHMWDLNPFNSLRDNMNMFTGNPYLKPEYTNSFELTGIQNFEMASFNIAAFHRRTNNVINETVTVEENASITSPKNIGESFNTGVEVNGKTEPFRWLAFLGDFNWTHYRRTGNYESQDFDFENTKWSARFTSKFKLPAHIDVEFKVRYRSKYKELEQDMAENFSANFGIRKKLLKGRAIINLSVRDAFNTNRHKFSSSTSSYYFSENHWHGRHITLGFSFGFGKGEAMEFSGNKMF